jgi:hypothetical protein
MKFELAKKPFQIEYQQILYKDLREMSFMVVNDASLLLLLLFNSITNGVLPDGSCTTIGHNTQKYTYHTK